MAGAAGPSSPMPAVSLPKGGGAIRGIGEKFGTNPVTGTGAVTIPVATSTGRSDFGPHLELAYDSGSGNSAFGFGWSLNVPAITRKTDKGLPRYDDAAESDVFVLSAVEDLVPVYALDAGGAIRHDAGGRAVFAERERDGWVVRRFRPRVDHLYARIERWTRSADPSDVHWRSYDRDNVLSVYGLDEGSRVADTGRIFTWLLSETRDDKGNAALYSYRPDDGTGVPLASAHQRNRGDAEAAGRRTNRYLKSIRYGNRTPLLDAAGRRPAFLSAGQPDAAQWLFEVVLDYGEHDLLAPTPGDDGAWAHREDAFSSYRSGFEIRTTRLCRRVLMFHHFPDEPGVGNDCLVRSTDLEHEVTADGPDAGYAFLHRVHHRAHRRDGATYVSRSMPPVELTYTRPVVDPVVHDVDAASLANLPIGVDGTTYTWVDLHGDGVPGILSEQAGAWWYKQNLSPSSERPVELGPSLPTGPHPNVSLATAQLIDLVGDGVADVVTFDGPLAGAYSHDQAQGWMGFRAFTDRLNRDSRDRHSTFLDLTGDGRSDVLITEDDVLVWHESLGADGFDSARSVAFPTDDERGPRVVLFDGAETISVADMTGDGLSDLVRVRLGEVSYWPNLGYGSFGAKVTMDNAPHFESPDLFDPRRVRLADIDGTGTTDLIYLHADGVRLYFNSSGNRWSDAQHLPSVPVSEELTTVAVTDLRGNGTACLVWSTPIGVGRQLRYLDLMSGQKPHLLTTLANNLGLEVHFSYAPSTSFALRDQAEGRPWQTRLPFPVQVVDRVETVDRISRNRIVSTYSFHDGYYDGVEREFCGFGLVEQQDAQIIGVFGDGANHSPASDVPPVLTRTWFHTGASQVEGSARPVPAGLLPAGSLPPGLVHDEQRQAARAMRGRMLRQEVYAVDGTPAAELPYTVVEQTHAVRCEQRQERNRHAVFITHSRETATVNYERNPADPRTQHALVLEVDAFGNPVREAAVAYGRRVADVTLDAWDQARQATTLATSTRTLHTNPVDEPDDYRAPAVAEVRTWEITGCTPEDGGVLMSADQWERDGFALVDDAPELAYDASPAGGVEKRVVECIRTLFRPDDLGAADPGDSAALLPIGVLEPRALSGESYKLALTTGLVDRIFRRDDTVLLGGPGPLLGAGGPEGGGYVAGAAKKASNLFPATDPDDEWWVPSGRVHLSAEPADHAIEELAAAQAHFFLPRRYADPFDTPEFPTQRSIDYDAYDLLLSEARDAAGNRITVGERTADGSIDLAKPGNDYRTMRPQCLTDPNDNRTEIRYDVLGLPAATAVRGPRAQALGDDLTDLVVDLDDDVVQGHLADPLADPHSLLGGATSRTVYDLFAYHRSHDQADPAPVAAYTVSRETHQFDEHGEPTRVQHQFSYSDGTGLVVQRKALAEPDRAADDNAPRWTGSGWVVHNNKGKPVKQYEPFFSATHSYEFAVLAGVSATLFYDPIGRHVATLHADHSYEKTAFDAWRHVRSDPNDTVLADPRTDPDVAALTAGFFADLADAGWLTWHAARVGPGDGLGADERDAAEKAARHADTPTTIHLDPLGRPFLTVEHNGLDVGGEPVVVRHRVELDIEGNRRVVRDGVGAAPGRVVSTTDFDLLSNRLRHATLDGGTRWTLQDAVGKPLRAWDSRSHAFRTTYDALRRPTEYFVTGADPARPDVELLSERIVYGEQLADAVDRNLRGKPYLHLDQAGAAACEEYDFKGNLVRSTRRLVRAYDSSTDWAGVDPNALLGVLEPETYESRTAYDAMNRPTLLTTPQAPGLAADGVRYRYNEAGLLERVDVNVQSESGADGAVWTAFVTNIDYDAKAQRTRVEHGNGGVTESAYDATTFRLRSLDTRVAGEFVQGLRYAYDAVGNVTLLRDEAQQTLFFRNQQVVPDRSYRYDPLYRLIEASGREHIGAAAATPYSYDDRLRLRLPHPGDLTAMARYSEQYEWDLAGNLRQLRHRGTDPATPGWTRDFDYAEPSLVEPGAFGNRLSHTSLDGGATEDAYGHDAHGNMVAMPALQVLAWDHKDLLRHVTRQQVDADDADGVAHVGEQTYYASDLAGTRVRKVTRTAAGGAIEERIYLGGFEIFRRHTGASAGLVRTTLHVMDDQDVVALVENRNGVDDGTDKRVVRYQLADHLGSSTVELGSAGEVLSYEEYSPFGSTTYQAILGRARAPKRYRFLGKERDEESGLCLLGARYYAPWLARWISCDPAGAVEGSNLYVYSRDNPVSRRDDGGHQSQEVLKQRRRDIIKTLGDELKKKDPDYGRAAILMNGLNNGDIRDQVGKALQGKTKAESHAILQSLYTGAIKQPGVGEKANIVTQLEKYDPKQALTKPAAVAPAPDAAKKEEKYKFIVAINVSSKTKFGDQVDTSKNPGHTFIVLKDASGKVVKSFSYGPVEHPIRGGLSCGIEGTTGYGLHGQDQYNLYEFEITKDQYDKAVKKIDEIDKAPGRFNATHQCTTTSLEVADAAGVSLPSGKTGISIPLCEEPASVSTPLGLDRELRAKGLTPKTVPATEFKDSMNVK